MNPWRWALAAWRAWMFVLSPLVALVVLHPRLRPRARAWLGFPDAPVEPGAVWLHAASLGEGRAAGVLAAALRVARPDLPLLRTCTSATAASQPLPVDAVLAPPLDTPFFVARWLDRVRPRALVLVEAELWPCLLAGCRGRGVPVVVVQARVGPGLRRVRAWPGAWEALTEGVTFFAADDTVGRLLGVPVTGDLKAEAERPPPAFTWDRPAIVAGSTHPGEEAALLDAVEGLDPRPLLILAPRAPARFAEVRALASGRSGRCVARSSLRAEGRKPPTLAPDVDVVVVDTIGELAGLYAGAGVAFVGGTFVASVGGHSPAEAAGCVIVAGPERHANAGAWAAAGEVVAVADGDGGAAGGRVEALRGALRIALERASRGAGRGVSADVSRGVSVGVSRGVSVNVSRGASGDVSRGVSGDVSVGAVGGAAGRTAAALTRWLTGPVPPERALRPWLWPVGWLWLGVTRLRPAPLRAGGVPVVAVGGLTAGGSGKTPVTAWFASALASRRPVVLARGYGRRAGADVRVTGGAAELGDELAMLAGRGIRVASAPDRAEALRMCRAGDDPPGAAILDDAFLYRGLARDLEVVVVDARWPEGGGPIPVGLRRAPLAWLRRADVLWVNHGALPERLRPYLRADVVVVEADVVPMGWVWRGADGTRVARSLAEGPGEGAVTVVAGIARPAGFLKALRRLGVRFGDVRVYPDHHTFTEADRAALDAVRGPIVTTEKDLVRLPEGLAAWALVVEVRIRRGEEALRAVMARRLGG